MQSFIHFVKGSVQELETKKINSWLAEKTFTAKKSDASSQAENVC